MSRPARGSGCDPRRRVESEWVAAGQQPPSGDDLFAHGVEDDLSRIVQIQLLHQMRAVCLDGIGTDIEKGCDVLVRLTLGQQLKNLTLALTQQFVGVLQALLLELTNVVLGQGLRDGGAEERSAGGDCADGAKQIGLNVVLQEIALHSGRERADQKLLVGVHAEDDDLYVGSPPQDLSRRVDSVQLGHGDVQHDYGRAELFSQRRRLHPIGRLAHDLDVLLSFEQRLQAGSDDVVIVRNQDGYFQASPLAIGSSQRSSVPRPGVETNCTRPFNCCTLSSMLSRPRPRPRAWRTSNPRPSSSTVSESLSAPPWSVTRML